MFVATTAVSRTPKVASLRGAKNKIASRDFPLETRYQATFLRVFTHPRLGLLRGVEQNSILSIDVVLTILANRKVQDWSGNGRLACEHQGSVVKLY